jgi:hypothetical protein
VRMSSACPIPNLEGQGVSLCLVCCCKPDQHGWPYHQLGHHKHSFQSTLVHTSFLTGLNMTLARQSSYAHIQNGFIYKIKCICCYNNNNNNNNNNNTIQ